MKVGINRRSSSNADDLIVVTIAKRNELGFCSYFGKMDSEKRKKQTDWMMPDAVCGKRNRPTI